VQSGTVVYCALEGGAGFSNRVEAWRQRYLAADHDEREIPFFLLDVPLDLAADHAALIKTIIEQVTDAPSPVCIVIDTLNRALAGSENNPEDMGKFIKAADAIRVAFECLVVIVHHSGIERGRPRGHTSLSGADDVQIKVERDSNGTGNTITATVEHMKDDEAGAIVTSRLERVELGLDEDREEMSSCVIVACDEVVKKMARDDWGNSKTVKLLRRIVMSLLAKQGIDLRPFANGPIERALRVDQVRAEFFKAHYADAENEKAKQNAKRMAFKRAIEAAGDKIIIREVDEVEYIWLAHADHEAEAGTIGGEAMKEPPGKHTPSAKAYPLMSWEVDELLARGFTRTELFDNPGSAWEYRGILADPRYEHMHERFRVGAKTAEPCSWCDEGGNVRMITGTNARGQQQTAALHLKHAPLWFESCDLPLEDPAPSSTGNKGTSASVAAFLATPVKDELRAFGCSEEYIHNVLPADAHKFLAQRRKLAAVLTAWLAAIGANQPRTVNQLIRPIEDAAVAGDEAASKFRDAVLAAVAGTDMSLEDWLRENSGIEVGQLTLREAGTDKDGRAQWTLEPRVEPDKGSGAD
jgi:hypothetical protein